MATVDVLDRETPAVPEVDPQRPSVARMYNYFLGGVHNFAADREAAAAALTAMPELPAIVRLNRRFLRRVVEAAVAGGVDQFLDLGCGIPSAGDTRDVLRGLGSHARVVGVDREPSAYLHGRVACAGDPDAGMLLADLTDADAVLGSEVVRGLIDPGRPVCLLLVAVGHFIPDTARLRRALERYRDAVAPGSMFALAHGCRKRPSERIERVRRVYHNTTAPMVLRDREEVRALFGDWPVDDPGIATVAEWFAGSDPQVGDGVAASAFLVGVSRKPHAYPDGAAENRHIKDFQGPC